MMDKRVTRVDLERVGATGILVRQWFGGWNQDDAGAPDIEDYIETGSIAPLLAQYEQAGFTVEMAHAGAGRALRGPVTRVDILHEEVSGTWRIRKFPYGWTAKTRPIHEKHVTQAEVQAALQWLRDNKWNLREWPGGYRAFRGSPKPVRDRATILSMRRKATEQRSNMNWDFAFDF